jgi:hypothetical protein
MVFNATFKNILAVSLTGGGNRSIPQKPPLQEKDALPCLVFRHGKCLDFSYHIAVSHYYKRKMP